MRKSCTWKICSGAVLAAVAACAEHKSPTAAEAVPASKSEPVKSEPVKSEPVKPEPAPTPMPAKQVPAEAAAVAVPATGDACDPGGTWRLEIVPGEEGCAAMKDEQFDLALGFVHEAAGTTLASAGKPVGQGDALGRLLPALRSARVVGPRSDCGLRITLGPTAKDPATHVELLLALERGELTGVGVLWGKASGKRCTQMFSVFGKRSTEPAQWAALGATVPAPKVDPPRAASDELAAAARKVDAKSLLGGVPAARASVKLRGTIADYVAAIVAGPKSVRLLDVACSGPSASDGRCVAVVGDPCSPGLPDAGEDCEGMYLTVVLDPRTGKLDRADAGGYPVESQADVEERLEMAP